MQGILHTNIIIIIIYISFCWTRSSWNFSYAPRILFYIHVQRLTYIHSSIRLIWLENGLCQIYFNHLPRKEHTALASWPLLIVIDGHDYYLWFMNRCFTSSSLELQLVFIAYTVIHYIYTRIYNAYMHNLCLASVTCTNCIFTAHTTIP